VVPLLSDAHIYRKPPFFGIFWLSAYLGVLVTVICLGFQLFVDGCIWVSVIILQHFNVLGFCRGPPCPHCCNLSSRGPPCCNDVSGWMGWLTVLLG
jgi:hypothetical protein